MKKRQLYTIMIGNLLVIGIIIYLLIYVPISVDLVDFDFDRIESRLSEYSKYNMDTSDLLYLKALGKVIVEGYNLSENLLNIIRSGSNYLLIVFFISIFQIIYLPIVFSKKERQ